MLSSEHTYTHIQNMIKCMYYVIHTYRHNYRKKNKTTVKRLQTDISETHRMQQKFIRLMHGPAPTPADFLPKRKREEARVSAIWEIMSCLFGFCGSFHIWMGNHCLSECVMLFPTPTTHQSTAWNNSQPSRFPHSLMAFGRRLSCHCYSSSLPSFHPRFKQENRRC